MQEPGGGTPPGWYADPEVPGGQRYWDGSRWTEQRSAAVVTQPVVVAQAPPTNGKAIAALVLGITWLCGIGSILALVFGYSAKSEIEESGGTQQGSGFAIAGIVLGWIGVAGLILYALWWVFIGGLALLGGSSSS